MITHSALRACSSRNRPTKRLVPVHEPDRVRVAPPSTAEPFSHSRFDPVFITPIPIQLILYIPTIRHLAYNAM
jgi:hypothetical protein